MDKTKRSEIIARIEDMRHDLKLSKSKFCAAFGMSAQTYNNFVGTQGSKPNIELLMGVVEAYRAHDRAGALAWILWGDGGPGVSNDDRLSRVEADVATLKDGLLTHCHDMDASVGGGDTTSAIFLNPDDNPGFGDGFIAAAPYKADPPAVYPSKSVQRRMERVKGE